jgi:predicted small integral membrane protein
LPVRLSAGVDNPMRIFKSLLVSLIGLTALIYGLQGVASIGAMRIEAAAASHPGNAVRDTILSGSPAASWIGFVLVTLCQFVVAAVAMKGALDLFVARSGTDAAYKDAKSMAIWAGGLSLLSWFALSLMIGVGLFQWGSDFGAIALARTFQLGSTSALTILFVNGVRD